MYKPRVFLKIEKFMKRFEENKKVVRFIWISFILFTALCTSLKVWWDHRGNPIFPNPNGVIKEAFNAPVIFPLFIGIIILVSGVSVFMLVTSDN